MRSHSILPTISKRTMNFPPLFWQPLPYQVEWVAMAGCDYADWRSRISGWVGVFGIGALESVSEGYQSRWWVNGAGDQNPV